MSSIDEVTKGMDSISVNRRTKSEHKAGYTDDYNDDDKPLTQSDVNEERKKLLLMPAKQMNRLVDDFSNCLTRILTAAEKRLKQMEKDNPDEDYSEDIVLVTQIRGLMAFCPNEELFVRTKGKVWKVKDHILKRNVNYFRDRDYNKLIKKDSNEAFIYQIIDLIKDQVDVLTSDELEYYWKQVAQMLQCVAIFKKTVKESRQKKK